MPESIENVLVNLDEEFFLNINKLVLDYARKGKIIDQKYLSSLTAIFIKKFNLQKYLLKAKLCIKSSDKSDEASYNIFLKRIEINLECFLKDLSNVANFFNLSANDMVYLIYTYFNKIFFHEICHSYQILELYEGNNLDSKIFNATLKQTSFATYLSLWLPKELVNLSDSLAKRNKEFVKMAKVYRKYYVCAPEERLAEYFANDLTLLLINRLQKLVNLDNLSSFYDYVLLKNLLAGYEISLSPTAFYLDKMGKNFYLPAFEQLNRRLIYGLKISKKEYSSLKRMKKSLYNNLKSR